MSEEREYWTTGNLMAVGFREIAARHNAEVAALTAERDRLQQELADLREKAIVAVPVPTVTPEWLAETFINARHQLNRDWIDWSGFAEINRHNHIAAAARVLEQWPKSEPVPEPEPAGVPSVATVPPVASPTTIEALAEIGYAEFKKFYNSHYPMMEDSRRVVTAILRAARPVIDDLSHIELGKLFSYVEDEDEFKTRLIDYCNSRIRWTQPAYDVEALAKAIYEGFFSTMKWTDVAEAKIVWMDAARAAIAHLGGRVEG